MQNRASVIDTDEMHSDIINMQEKVIYNNMQQNQVQYFKVQILDTSQTL